MRPETVVEKLLVDSVEILTAAVFVIEHLDHLFAVHHFLHEALDLAERLLLTDEVFGGAAARPSGDEHNAEYPQNHHQRQPQAVVEHDEEHGGDENNGL